MAMNNATNTQNGVVKKKKNGIINGVSAMNNVTGNNATYTQQDSPAMLSATSGLSALTQNAASTGNNAKQWTSAVTGRSGEPTDAKWYDTLDHFLQDKERYSQATQQANQNVEVTTQDMTREEEWDILADQQPAAKPPAEERMTDEEEKDILAGELPPSGKTPAQIAQDAANAAELKRQAEKDAAEKIESDKQAQENVNQIIKDEENRIDDELSEILHPTGRGALQQYPGPGEQRELLLEDAAMGGSKGEQYRQSLDRLASGFQWGSIWNEIKAAEAEAKPVTDCTKTDGTKTTIPADKKPTDGSIPTYTNPDTDAKSDDGVWYVDKDGKEYTVTYDQRNNSFTKSYRVGPAKTETKTDKATTESQLANTDLAGSTDLIDAAFSKENWFDDAGSQARISNFFKSLKTETAEITVAGETFKSTTLTDISEKAYDYFVRKMSDQIDRQSLALRSGVELGQVEVAPGIYKDTVEVVKENERKAELLSDIAGMLITADEVKDISSWDTTLVEKLNAGYKVAADTLSARLTALNNQNTEAENRLAIAFQKNEANEFEFTGETGAQLAQLQSEWEVTKKRLLQLDEELKQLKARGTEEALIRTEEAKRRPLETEILTEQKAQLFRQGKFDEEAYTARMQQVTQERDRVAELNALTIAQVSDLTQRQGITFERTADGKLEFSGEGGPELAKLKMDWEAQQRQLERLDYEKETIRPEQFRLLETEVKQRERLEALEQDVDVQKARKDKILADVKELTQRQGITFTEDAEGNLKFSGDGGPELAQLQAQWETTSRELKLLDAEVSRREREKTLEEDPEVIAARKAQILAEKDQILQNNALLAQQINQSRQEEFIKFSKEQGFTYDADARGAPINPGAQFAQMQAQWQTTDLEIKRLKEEAARAELDDPQRSTILEQQALQLTNENTQTLHRMSIVFNKNTGFSSDTGEGVDLARLQSEWESEKERVKTLTIEAEIAKSTKSARIDTIKEQLTEAKNKASVYAAQALEIQARNSILFDPEEGFTGDSGGLELANAQANYITTKLKTQQAERDLRLSEEEQQAIKDFFPELEEKGLGALTTPRLLAFAERQKDQERNAALAKAEIAARTQMSDNDIAAQERMATERSTAQTNMAAREVTAQQNLAISQQNAARDIANMENRNRIQLTNLQATSQQAINNANIQAQADRAAQEQSTALILAAIQSPFNFRALLNDPRSVPPQLQQSLRNAGINIPGMGGMQRATGAPYTLGALGRMTEMNRRQYAADMEAQGLSQADLARLSGGVTPGTQMMQTPLQVMYRQRGRE